MQEIVPEAQLTSVGHGLEAASAGWFVVNIHDARWQEHPRFGRYCAFEGQDKASRFGDIGINVHMLHAGQRACLYHRESVQEGFLVLSGECLLLVNDEERTMKQWDFFHCPPGTTHVFVGKSDPACAILMIGRREEGLQIHYPKSEFAAKYAASTREATDDPREAYAGEADKFDIPAPAAFAPAD